MRALESKDSTLPTTFCISVVAPAWSSLLMPGTSPRSAEPHRLTRFHRAPPLCAGSGVRIPRPGCARSFQSWMPLRVAGSHVEHHDRARHHALVGRLGPVVRDQAGVLDRLHVGRERQRHDVGAGPVHHVLGLGRRAGVGLEELRLDAGLVLPHRLEGGDDLGVIDLTRRAVRGEGQGRDGGRRAVSPQASSSALEAVQCRERGRERSPGPDGTIRRVNQRGIRAPSRSTDGDAVGRDTGSASGGPVNRTASRALQLPRCSRACAPVIRSRDVDTEIPDPFAHCQASSRGRNTSEVGTALSGRRLAVPCGGQLTSRLEAAARRRVAAFPVRRTKDRGCPQHGDNRSGVASAA